MEGTRTATAFRLTARPRAESPNRPRIAEACGLKRATEPASKFAAHADAGTAARAPADAADAPARTRVEAAPPRETARTAPMPVKGVTTEDIVRWIDAESSDVFRTARAGGRCGSVPARVVTSASRCGVEARERCGDEVDGCVSLGARAGAKCERGFA